MENQESPPLDPTLAPALLFEPGHGGLGARSRRLDPSTRDACLRDPFSSRTVRLPSDHPESLLPSSNEHTRCLMSKHRPTAAAAAAAADDDPAGCIVLLVHLEEPVLWYCSPGGSRWLRHEYSPKLIASDDHSHIMWAMSRLTAARGKFYTLVYGDGRDNKIMALEFSPAGPIFSTTHLARTPFLSRFLQVQLVESCGDLFFFQRVSLEPFCAQSITEINVYKLVLSSNDNAWVKVKVATLGDNRVFFCGSDGGSYGYEFGASMAADEVGLKPNCIYFTHGVGNKNDKGLYVHDLERGTTTLHNPATNVPDSAKPLLLTHAIL
ncbi:hypothetical protein BDA96_03G143300 [Sorghum bicolor]|uniref:KIB1-4 beta-propeller domain-containing protein n=2 Tax=Sorghum bicolor TaxID=4558 RepID=A0A921UMP0_SORBI|nr:hypothetical protein BDA96_03G143300 [Sorghum bicolor]OQU89447.1 hypothetical protein SORBI_3002G191450 [Sorghum bicolor]